MESGPDKALRVQIGIPTAVEQSGRIAKMIWTIGFLQFFLTAIADFLPRLVMSALWFAGGLVVSSFLVKIDKVKEKRQRYKNP